MIVTMPHSGRAPPCAELSQRLRTYRIRRLSHNVVDLSHVAPFSLTAWSQISALCDQIGGQEKSEKPSISLV